MAAARCVGGETERSIGERAGLNVPGKLSKVGWALPADMTFDQWLTCGRALTEIEGSVQWWLGDWWAYGEGREWGSGQEVAEKAGVNYWTVAQYGSVARAYEFCDRSQKLTFTHHLRTVEDYGWVAENVKTTERSVVLTWYHHRCVAPLPPAEQCAWLQRDDRKATAKLLASKGMSTREIARITGWDHATIARDLAVANATRAVANATAQTTTNRAAKEERAAEVAAAAVRNRPGNIASDRRRWFLRRRQMGLPTI